MLNIEQLMSSAMQRVVTLYFQKILYVDLTDDFYHILKLNNTNWNTNVEAGTKVSEWFEWFADSDLCHPMDKDRFREFTRLDNLRRLFGTNGNRTVRMRYRRKKDSSDKHFHRVVMDMIPETAPNGHQILFLFVRDIKNENILEAEMVQQLENTIVQSSFGNIFKSLLIIDDCDLNVEILMKILGDEYNIYVASNGFEGLDILREHSDEISLVLLDLYMPKCDGFEFLKFKSTEPDLAALPVIVITSSQSTEDEIRCLKLGASDFINKPFNPDVVKMRISGTINLHESATILSELETDQLTGLLTKRAFYHRAKQRLMQNPKTDFCIIYLNIENFKLINERYGEATGDEVLRYIGSQFAAQSEVSLFARFNADHFLALTTDNDIDSLTSHITAVTEMAARNAPVLGITLRFGIYQNVDRSKAVSILCDRAALAASAIKSKYGQNFAFYDEKMSDSIRKEKLITDCMEEALEKEQFLVYYQPKHDIHDNRIIGAEALVRWIHPEMGFMSPGDFIPIFEKNGFISNVDFYVWDHTCRNLKKWQEEGLDVVPISVNASRKDFFSRNFLNQLMDSVKEYGISTDLLHIEVTESLYTENSEELISVVNEVQSMGFKIEMDDFGSGYSSLNMLSAMPMDILKLDMRFMGDLENKKKRTVLETCINLAKRLELRTVAEGIETEEQKDILKSMGCDYVQGYYYSRPLSEKDFEEYLRSNQCAEIVK